VQAEIKDNVLKHILQSVSFDGWSQDSLRHGAKKAGYDDHFSELIFPGGVKEVLDCYIMDLDRQMIAIALKERKSSARVKEMLVNRVKIIAQNKLLAAKTISFLALPWNLPQATKMLWRTVDLIWLHAGNDLSTDFNHYSKRGLLASIYSSAIMYMLSDQSDNLKDTFEFIDRKFIDVKFIGEKIGKFKEWVAG
jgi:ubiquinone biosynthesis protein COQ9